MSKTNKADMSLVLVTIGWGASFILAKSVLGELSVFNFLAIRFLLAFAIALVIFIKPIKRMTRETLIDGIGLGVILFLGFSIQTFGLSYTTVSKSAFITGLSVVLVPLIIALIHKRAPQLRAIIGSLTAVGGLGLLTMSGSSFSINLGDFLSIIGACFFALHIVGVELVSSKAKDIQAVPMAILQIGTVGFLSLGFTFLVEAPKLPTNMDTWLNVFVLALVCTAGAYIVQNVAQQYTTATRTALIYATEPIFAGICGFILLGETLGLSAILGAGLILSGTLISELPIDYSRLLRRGAKNLSKAEA